jgi:hypothetical protein
MSFEITVDVEAENLASALRDASSRIAAGRAERVLAASRVVIGRIAALTPVETGRLRDGWDAASASIAIGIDGGNGGEGDAVATSDAGTTEVIASNRVPYGPFVEYGTRQQAPAGMVRRGVSDSRSEVLAMLGELLSGDTA